MNAFMGGLGFSTYDGIVSPAYAVAQPRRKIEPLYFHYLLRTTAYTAEFNRLSYGIMYERNRLYFERFKLVPAIVPPIDEQTTIVRGIEKQTVSLNTAIVGLEREVALLWGYRTRLVADVVTGKLDVRAAARQLPAEPIEPDPAIPIENLTEEAEFEPAAAAE
jgi:type I restriction enzyme S subunit